MISTATNCPISSSPTRKVCSSSSKCGDSRKQTTNHTNYTNERKDNSNFSYSCNSCDSWFQLNGERIRMEQRDHPRTGAEVLVSALRDHGIRHVFGYPGGQLTPIYDALYRESSIRHILARDEQAAAFMADGYARASGRPGVCLAVCGPGVLNAATPLATAFTDSIPVLLISGQIATAGRGLRSGYYHENDQLEACKTFTKHRARPVDVQRIVSQLDEAFQVMLRGRTGPALY